MDVMARLEFKIANNDQAVNQIIHHARVNFLGTNIGANKNGSKIEVFNLKCTYNVKKILELGVHLLNCGRNR